MQFSRLVKEEKMKKIFVLRKKAFAGSLLPYWIIVGISKASFMQNYDIDGDLCDMDTWGNAVSRIDIEELDKIGTRINNGQVIELPVEDDVSSLFVITMDGCLSNEIDIDDCLKTNEKQAIIKTKGGFKKLSYPVVEY